MHRVMAKLPFGAAGSLPAQRRADVSWHAARKIDDLEPEPITARLITGETLYIDGGYHIID